MRSAQADDNGYTTFGAFLTDAASGVGVAQPGSVPYSFVRNSAGDYSISWGNKNARAVAGEVSPYGLNIARLYTTDAPIGSARVLMYTTAGALASSSFYWQVTVKGVP